MVTKPPPEVLTTEKLSFMSTLSEYQRRRFLATEALALGRRGVDKVSQFVGASKNTLYNGIYDVTTNTGYMTIGTSHDTSKFCCDNIERVWHKYLRRQYPQAHHSDGKPAQVELSCQTGINFTKLFFNVY